MPVDTAAAVQRLMHFLAVPGITGEEAKIAKEIQAALKAAGVAPRFVKFDDVNTRIPVPTQTGNLIVQLPGNGTMKTALPLLFMTHMDTVPLCAGAKPKQVGRKILNEANTALGGDNRTGCAVLVSLAAELISQKPNHPPITLLFTVREESGLFGARYLNPKELGDVAMGFNFDGRSAADVIVGAVGADRWEADITGKASHAGVAPERGISATMIFAVAMAEIRQRGWFGKVSKEGREGTSNIGSVGDAHGKSAGEATNVVTDYMHVKGESRSHNPKFVREITTAYKAAFDNALTKITDHEGKRGRVKFTVRADYHPFRMRDDAPVVVRTAAAVRKLNKEPNLRVTNGGLDANWMIKHGIPTVTLGVGQNEIHTVKEWVDLAEFENAVKLAFLLATME